MGAVAGLVADSSQACCTNRRLPVKCWNPLLNVRLQKLGQASESFEEAWLFKDNLPELDSSPWPMPDGREAAGVPIYSGGSKEEAHYAIVYNYGPPPPTSTTKSSPSSAAGLKPLRLDWRPDGLSFLDGGLQPREEVRLKVFHRPLKVEELQSHLKELKDKTYDPASFNSKHFCEFLFEQADGTEEDP